MCVCVWADSNLRYVLMCSSATLNAVCTFVSRARACAGEHVSTVRLRPLC